MDIANIVPKMNKATQLFFNQQIRNIDVKGRGRRFTFDEKLLSLSLLKVSNKGYNVLCKLFVLPSKRTLRRLLAKIDLKPGFNRQYFQCLSEITAKMPIKDRICALLFDEISLSTNLTYNKGSDTIEGFEHDGNAPTGKIANTANVFMLKGISRQWKQPIAFTFSNGPTDSTTLKDLIKNLIRECQNMGFNVVATICDQGSNNQAAINKLIAESKVESESKGTPYNKLGFLINNKEIVPLYDVPHLIKGIRNNLLTKDLHYEDEDGVRKVATWKHIVNLYELDNFDNVHMLPLTDQHVIAEKMNKMKV